jgi:three-Cys-motif partner protein
VDGGKARPVAQVYRRVTRRSRAIYSAKGQWRRVLYRTLFGARAFADQRHNDDHRWQSSGPYKAAQDSGSIFSEMHLADIVPDHTAAVQRRIQGLGGQAMVYPAEAERAVDDILHALNPSGLHFAFIDPFDLELPFEIIAKLARVRHMDMLIHVSVHDLQRNLDNYSRPGGVLDRFAPDWGEHVDQKQAIQGFRSALLKYWLQKIRELGTMPAQGIELVSGSRGQRLYWLVFVSRHNLGQKLWDDVRNLHGQIPMEF